MARVEHDHVFVLAELDAGKPLHALCPPHERARLGFEVHTEGESHGPVLYLPGVIPCCLHERVRAEREESTGLRPPPVGYKLRRLPDVRARDESKRRPEILPDIGVVELVGQLPGATAHVGRICGVPHVIPADWLSIAYSRLTLQEPLGVQAQTRIGRCDVIEGWPEIAARDERADARITKLPSCAQDAVEGVVAAQRIGLRDRLTR